mmetsp:Transcript_14774/g.50368  ORF Transcript_14774/g.50368 Transcript_14774/m.50368 type:complete len:206 (-) Transcript_14774:121-738(-)
MCLPPCFSIRTWCCSTTRRRSLQMRAIATCKDPLRDTEIRLACFNPKTRASLSSATGSASLPTVAFHGKKALPRCHLVSSTSANSLTCTMRTRRIARSVRMLFRTSSLPAASSSASRSPPSLSLTASSRSPPPSPALSSLSPSTSSSASSTCTSLSMQTTTKGRGEARSRINDDDLEQVYVMKMKRREERRREEQRNEMALCYSL